VQPRRGQRRFWVTLDNRYKQYIWPALFVVRCPHCRAKARFSPSVTHAWVKDAQSGGYRLLELALGGRKEGMGSCTSCGHSFAAIHWPEDAYYCTPVHGALLWAWNEDYLEVLRARVAGNRVLERQLCLHDRRFYYFVTRIPKNVVIKRNRPHALRIIDGWLGRRIFASPESK